MVAELSVSGRPPRVLVTGIGGPAAQGFVDALDGAGIDWFVADADPLAPAFILFPPSRRVIVPRGDSPDYADALVALSAAMQVDVVVPTVDAELSPLSRSLHRLGAIGTSVLMTRRLPLRTALDKWLLMTTLRDRVHVPASALLDEQFDAVAWEYPAVAKPRKGSGSRGIVTATSSADLAALPRDGSYLVQEYLPGPEYSIDVLARRDATVAAAVPRERLRVDSGIACVSRTVRDPRLVELGRRTVETTGLTGIANVQCRLDRAGRPAVIEINPRVPGTIGLTVASGVNMPRLALAEILGVPVPDGLRFEERAVVRTWQQHVIDPAELLPDSRLAVSA